MFLNTDTEYLVLNRAAADHFRVIRGEDTPADAIRRLVIGSANGQEARLVSRRGDQSGPNGPCVVETINAVIETSAYRPEPIPVEYVFVHTEKSAPDGRKTMVYLASVRRLSAEESEEDDIHEPTGDRPGDAQSRGLPD
jgi:hypothetical protein